MRQFALMTVTLLLACVGCGKSYIEKSSYFHIRDMKSQMTTVQWRAYVQALEGTEVEWQGWVRDVHRKIFGGYDLYVDMDPPREMSTLDVTFDIEEFRALQLRRGQFIVFRGTIGSVHRFLGSCQVILKNVSILES